MTFTKTPPTTPGLYLWRTSTKQVGDPFWVTAGDDGTLWRDCKWPATNGEWCRLVPDKEIELAWDEANSVVGITSLSPAQAWAMSRARRVMEGRE